MKLSLRTARFGYTKAELDAMPAEDFAGPDQSFPIKVKKDVKDAWDLAGHAANPGVEFSTFSKTRNKIRLILLAANRKSPSPGSASFLSTHRPLPRREGVRALLQPTCAISFDYLALSNGVQIIRSSLSGSTTVATVPRPGRLSSLRQPRCASQSALTIARPSPVPPVGRALDWSGR